MYDRLRSTVEAKKRELHAIGLRTPAEALSGLEHAQRIDITYSSNAIEGNTLTAGETALVLEKGMTISGKPLKDHLEAIDHAEALAWVLDVAARQATPILEADIRNLHRLVMAKSAPGIAGRYADRAPFVNTDIGLHQFPTPNDVPILLQALGDWLRQAEDTLDVAFEAHRRLVGIHPFNDGNGRTARLVMNLVLVRGGFPAIAIRPEDRPAYIAALEAEQRMGTSEAFHTLLLKRLDQTLDLYLTVARQAEAGSTSGGNVVPMRK